MSAPIPNDLPAEVWLGKNEGEWPIHVMTSEAAVELWLGQKHEPARADRPYRRHVWRVKLEVLHEVELVEPAPYIQPKTKAST